MMGPVGGKMSQAYGQSLPVPGPADWPSFGYDLQNTRFNVRESRLGRDTNHTRAGVEHHVRVLLVKGGKIKQLIVIVDPEEDASLRAREG